MSKEITYAARTRVARQAAVDQLVAAGDPVALALDEAIRVAQRVELTDALIDRALRMWEKQTGAPADISGVRALMVVAYEAAGFEVV